MNTANTTTEFVPTLFVYIGRATGADGAKCAKFIPLDLLKKCGTREEADRLSSLFAMKEREFPRAVGWVYSIKAKLDDNGGMIGIRGSHTIEADQRHGVDRSWLAHWQATEQAEKVAERARKLEAKYNRDELRARLLPLKSDWMKTDKLGRLALEVVILDILRNG